MNSNTNFPASITKKIGLVGGLFLLLVFSANPASAQSFTSKKDGKWNQNVTWNSSHSCGQWDNVSVGVPPINKNWGCAVNVVINHTVDFVGHATDFGAGVFNGIEIKSDGTLNFPGNVTFSGGGSVPTFIMESGAKLNVAGTFTVNRPVKIVIPSNSVVTIKNLVVGDSKPEITVQEGGQLIVLETTTLRSQSNLNIQGSLITKDLIFTSGGTLTADSNHANIEVANDLTVTNGTLNLNGKSTIVVGGKTNAGQSGTISLTHLASASFQKLVTIPHGATIRTGNTANFLFGENLDMSGGGKLELRNNTRGIIQGNVILPNGRIETHDFSEVYIGGKLIASNGGAVQTGNNSAFNICDFVNSTQISTYHITVQQNSFYGEGCIALPVVWGGFSILFESANKQVKLAWETTKEWENSHFVVERSLTGIEGYIPIGDVAAVGYSDLISSYRFEDKNLPNHSGFVFYRIKQVDMNGENSHSETARVTVANSLGKSYDSKWVAYPNPTNGDGFNLRLADVHTLDQGPITARIVSMGNSQPVQATDLSTLSLLIGQQISQAPKGVCVIEVTQGNEVTHLKILKY